MFCFLFNLLFPTRCRDSEASNGTVTTYTTGTCSANSSVLTSPGGSESKNHKRKRLRYQRYGMNTLCLSFTYSIQQLEHSVKLLIYIIHLSILLCKLLFANTCLRRARASVSGGGVSQRGAISRTGPAAGRDPSATPDGRLSDSLVLCCVNYSFLVCT